MENKEYNAFNEFEAIELENVPREVPKALREMKQPLTEYLDGQSVTKNSLDLLKTDNINLEPINTSNNTQNKTRVLTREMPGVSTSQKQTVSNVEPDYNSVNNSNNVYYGNNSNNSKGGFTDTAILLSIAVLIALVFLVSTAIIMYVGLK